MIAGDQVERGPATGAVYIFDQYQGGFDQWGLVVRIEQNNSMGFGTSVSLSNGTLVIAARASPSTSLNAGNAFLYKRQ